MVMSAGISVAARRHLNPGGVLALNTTSSYDVLATVQSVFLHAYRYYNFAYGSDHPLVPDPSRLLKVRRPDRALFTFDNAKPTSVASKLKDMEL